MSERERTSVFYSAYAPQYDVKMAGAPGNRFVRDAFRKSVVVLIPPRSLIIDFGCGTGDDALWFAARGHRVAAYDNAPGMIEVLRAKCATEIEHGTVEVFSGPYEDFQRALEHRGGPAHAVIANFAVLNSIRPDELSSLFDSWASLIQPGGWVVLNHLNPFFWREILDLSWWRGVTRNFERGYIRRPGPGPGIDVYLYPPSTVARSARPHFEVRWWGGLGGLIRYQSGDLSWDSPRTAAELVERRLWRNVLFRRLGRFQITALERL